MEEWRDVVGYEGLYQVSSLGRVRNFKKPRCSGRIFRKRILGKNDRARICLRKNGVHRYTSVARVIAETFLPNPENKSDVDHINRNPHDNRLVNLRWATHKENMANTVLKGGASKYKGVYFNRLLKSKPWYTQFQRKTLGHYGTEEEAASAYDVAALKTYGEFAVLNIQN